MKIGIFGGSFNPPHKMHENIAQELTEKGLLDKIIFVPTGNQYQKKDLIDSSDRYQMLKIIANKNKNYEVSNYEMKNKLTYTYQTMKYFQKKYKKDQLYFILGADNLESILSWKNHQYLLKHYYILVIDRGNQKERLQETMKKYMDHIMFAQMNENTLSSTRIREWLKQKNQNVLLELHPEVLKYIQTHKLYE